MRHLKVLVETIALLDELIVTLLAAGSPKSGGTTYMLLPLTEACLLSLNLLGEALAELLLFLLELGVLELARLLLAKLACLHLGLTVVLIVQFLRHRNQVKHVRADQQRAQLPEVAVVLVLDLRNTPEVLAALDNAPVGGGDVLSGSNDRERYGLLQDAGVLGTGLIIGFDGRLVNANSLGSNSLPDLTPYNVRLGKCEPRTVHAPFA